VVLVALDPGAEDLAMRMVNLAQATESEATVWLEGSDAEAPADARITVRLLPEVSGATEGVPTVSLGDDSAGALTGRMITALSSTYNECRLLEVELSEAPLQADDERQRQAVRLLDALCAALV
jgi:hypothetical protein